MGAEVITAITDFTVMTLAILFFSISAILKVPIIFDRGTFQAVMARGRGFAPRLHLLER